MASDSPTDPAPPDSADIERMIAFALRSFIRPKRPADADFERARAAAAVRKHLELCGVRFVKNPPLPPHSTGGHAIP